MTTNHLIKAVLEWWEENKYKTVLIEEDEHNVYDEPPEFVKIALKLENKKLKTHDKNSRTS